MGNEITRREVLKLSAACGLSFLLPPLESRAAEKRGTERSKSLILLWMNGGPSQFETWDPHPNSKFGGPLTSIPTTLKGAEISELYPRVAEELHSMSIIRSLISKEGDHERGVYAVKTGFVPQGQTIRHPSLGAIISKELEQPSLKIPSHISLGQTNWPGWGGYLGAEYDAFKVYEPGQNLHNMRGRVGEDRQQRRLGSLKRFEETFRKGRQTAVTKTLHQETLNRALEMMSSEQLRAFDIEKEPEQLKADYGENDFGRGCLIARKLVEEGVRAVEVTLNGWDAHANNLEFHTSNAKTLDPALSTLIRDLRDRDLLESTVVLCIGEFGRTPKINPLGGRDHHPLGFSCLLGGGGLRSGLVIGGTDPNAEKKEPTDPIRVEDLNATILHVLGIDYAQENQTPIGRPMKYCDGEHLERLIEA